MPEIRLEQALYQRNGEDPPLLRARSAGFVAAWLPLTERLLIGFGARPTGIPCPAATFAQPFGKEHVVVVQAADQPAGSGQLSVGFHLVVLPLIAYRNIFGDPFTVADRFPPPWHHAGSDLPALTAIAAPLQHRTEADVSQVLKRVKAGALREDQDPDKVELTAETAESPALLGGVQVLVDGGKLVFKRLAPDTALIRGLWLLLPNKARSELWPATFAFSNALGFDAVVVPRLGDEDFAGYTTEEQAADYPAGRYELNLQTAAESGDQAALDELFARRSSREILRLGLVMVIVLSLAVLMLRNFTPETPPHAPSFGERESAAIAAAMVSSGDPWTAAALHEFGRIRRAERAATAAGIVATLDPFAAAAQARAAHARYVEIWKAVK
jgi:hypothetical protein